MIIIDCFLLSVQKVGGGGGGGGTMRQVGDYLRV